MKISRTAFWCLSLLAAGVLRADARLNDAPVTVQVSPDGPIRSGEAALAEVRRLRAASPAAAARCAVIRFADGRYPVTAPLALTGADSNLRIEAAHPGRAVWDAGVPAPRFRAGGDGLWHAPVAGDRIFDQLYVNGRRAIRARSPNRFYHYMTGPGEAPTNGVSPDLGKDPDHRAFTAAPADIAPLAGLAPAALRRVVALIWQSWDQARARVARVDAATKTVYLQTGTGYPLFFWSQTCPRYALENFRAALDEPGEWFHDVEAGELLYMPRAGERPETAQAVMPQGTKFITVTGDVAARQFVTNVTVAGLVFENAAWNLPPTGAPNRQAVSNIRDAALEIDGAREVVVTDCTVRHVGLHGISLRHSCRHCAVRHCLIEDLGGGGVYIGDTHDWRQERREDITAFNRVEDCIIRSGGHALAGAIGVWVGHAHDNTIAHNDIGDFRYTGVSMGWSWGYGETIAHRNRLLWNRIHHIGQGVHSDMGGVYTLGRSPGTCVCCNWIHDVNGYRGCGSPAWGLYTDEGSTGVFLASNLVERCRDGAIHQNYGRENTFRNNILATFDRHGVWRGRAENHTIFFITNNIFWWTNPAAHVLNGEKSRSISEIVMDGNLYWGTRGIAENAFSGRDRATWLASGHDRSAVFADPRFADPEHGDWRLAKDSPAFALGFKAWDWTDAGVLKADAAWRRRAMDDSAIPPLTDAPPAPRYGVHATRQDFESFDPGSSDQTKGYGVLQYSVDSRGFAIVKGGFPGGQTPDLSGGQALEMTDGPGLKHSWQPHLTARIVHDTGDRRIHFAFRLEDAAVSPQFACRDYAPTNDQSFATGPNVSLYAGKFYARDRAMAKVPPGVWHGVDIVLHIPKAGAPTWDCTLTPVGGASVSLANLPTDRGFGQMDWAGFMSNGTKPGKWRLDDFRVE